MLGQKNLYTVLNNQLREDTLARFIIIEGELGSEKNLVARELAKANELLYAESPDCKIETMRQIIVDAYKVTKPTIFAILDADDMSVQAKNALLKVTEEPPNKARFVMTLQSVGSTLETIKSRATIYQADAYSRAQLSEYCDIKRYADKDLLLDVCSTPGDIDLVNGYGTKDFYDFVHKVTENVATVRGANSFKIAKSIKLKDTDEGYDLVLFFKTFFLICVQNDWFRGGALTGKYLADLRVKSVNKQMLFDSWLLNIRREWRDDNC